MMTRPLARTMMIAILLAAGTAACSRSEPEQDGVENAAVENFDAIDEALPAVEPSPLPSIESSANMAEALPPAEEPRPDEQMLDDASATGMTSRASRGEEAVATNAN